jgi:FMN-dependent NADH-azoreductase
MKVLQINSGVFGDDSQSTSLASSFIEKLKLANSNLEITLRDVIAQPIPHLDANILSAFMTAEADRTEPQKYLAALSDQLISEIKQADCIVLGLPMYNFGIPSQLKAYFDQLARAGITFKYTETGPLGLLDDIPVYILAARGGIHKGQASDSQTDFITTFFSFIGMNNVQFIYAEGLNMGVEVKETSIKTAIKSFETLIQ